MELINNNIQKAYYNVDAYMEGNGVSYTNRLCQRLLIEEYLLLYMETGKYNEFDLTYRRKGKKIFITLSVDGEEKDLTSGEESPIVKKLLSQSEFKPKWTYKQGKNIILLVVKPVLPDFNTILYVFRFMSKKKKSFMLAMALQVINIGVNILGPLLTAQIIVAYSASEINKVVLIAIALLAQVTAWNALWYASGYLLRISYAEMIKDMRSSIARQVLSIKTVHMDENGSGLFTQRMINTTTMIADQINSIMLAISDMVSLVSLIISFMIVYPKMLYLEIIIFFVYALIEYFRVDEFMNNRRAYNNVNEKFASFASEMIRANRDIKLLHSEESFIEEANKRIVESVKSQSKMDITNNKFVLARKQYIGISDFFYMILLAYFMVAHNLPVATALVLFNYNGRIYLSAYAFAHLLDVFYNLALSTESIYQLMNSSDFDTEKFGDKHLDHINGNIEFKNVTFSFKNSRGNNTHVLNGLDLKINSGEMVAIVGSSGCGKSTILSLIAHLYEVDGGEILLDGENINTLDKETIRGNIQMVSQMPYLFNMSIKDNLSIARENVTEQEIVETCKKACIYDDIIKMEKGFDTMIGEGGVTLSGGQRQRIAMARAFLKTTPILMLDEATSALDSIVQAKVQALIEQMRGKQTIIIIAHRLSTVINCDRIFVLGKGKLVAQGSHKELLEKSEEYRELYREESTAKA